MQAVETVRPTAEVRYHCNRNDAGRRNVDPLRMSIDLENMRCGDLFYVGQGKEISHVGEARANQKFGAALLNPCLDDGKASLSHPILIAHFVREARLLPMIVAPLAKVIAGRWKQVALKIPLRAALERAQTRGKLFIIFRRFPLQRGQQLESILVESPLKLKLH